MAFSRKARSHWARKRKAKASQPKEPDYSELSPYEEGKASYRDGLSLGNNPFHQGSSEFEAWACGWNDESKGA